MPKNDKSIPTVRLVGDAPRNARQSKPEKPQNVIKLAVRLDEGINDALRTLVRYRGDLAKFAVEALETVDLADVALVNPETMVRDTTISMSVSLHKNLKKLADQRGISMNIAVNTALAHWLAAKGAIRLR